MDTFCLLKFLFQHFGKCSKYRFNYAEASTAVPLSTQNPKKAVLLEMHANQFIDLK